MNEVARSNEYNKESVNEISREDVKNVEDFKDYYNQASEDEKQRLNQEFADNVQEEINKNPELKSAIEGEKIDSEVRSEDIENINTVNNLQDSLRNYPNIPEANRQAIDDMVYGPIKSSEKSIKNILEQNEKTEDQKIES